MDPWIELQALDARTVRDPVLLIGATIRALDWQEHAREVTVEFTDGKRAMVTAELKDGVPVLVLGEGKDSTLLREVVVARKEAR